MSLIAEAWAAHDRSDWPEAIRRWQSARSDAPAAPETHLGLGAAFREAGRYDEADAGLTAAISRFDDHFYLAVEHARVAQVRPDIDEALRRWSVVRERFSDRPAGYAGVAACLTALARIDEANAVTDEAAALFPWDQEILVQYAWAAHDARDWEQAVQRWDIIRRDFPANPVGYVGLGAALRELSRFDDADGVLSAAASLFPEDPDIAINYAIVATRQGRSAEARRRWGDVEMRFPGSATNKDAFADLCGNAASEAADILDARQLAQEFESLGDNCEFGMFQRHHGAEPLGLLRWANTPPELLIAAVHEEFEGVGEPENTVVEAVLGEWVTTDTRYWMAMHTWLYEKDIQYDDVFPKLCLRNKYLREKILDDLKSRIKIFCYKSRGLTEGAIDLLHGAIRSYGPNWLFCVRLADSDHPAGTVENRGDGLVIGYLEEFQPDDKVAGLPKEKSKLWLALCAQAHAIWREARAAEPIAPAASSRLSRRDVIRATSEAWTATHQRDFANALELWSAAYRAAPYDAGVMHGLGTALRDLGRFEEAESLLARATAAYPQNQILAVQHAWIAQLQPDLPLALRRWRSIRERFPDEPAGYLGQGVALRELNQLDEAELVLAEGVERFASDPAMINHHAWVASRRGDRLEAIRRWRSMVERFPDVPAGFLGLGGTLRDIGHFDEADAILGHARREFPNDAEIAIGYAYVATSRGDLAEAARRWQETVARFPTNKAAATALQRLSK